MVQIELLSDVCFLILGIAGAVFVTVMRKHFDKWISLLTCTAWVLKGIRLLCYDWIIIALDNVKENKAFLFMQNAHLALQGIDTLVDILLLAALVRLVMIGLYSRWYNKAIKTLIK